MIHQRALLSVAWLMGACAVLMSASAHAAPKEDQHYRAGVGMLAKGLNDLAEKELRAYLSEHPDGAEATNARYSLGVCLVRLGRHAEADSELARAIGDDFAFAADALMLRAQCALAASDDARVVKHLEVLIERHSTWDRLPLAVAMLGEARYRMHDMPGACSALEKFSMRWPESAAADRADLICAMAESAQGKHDAAASRAAGLRRRSPDGPHTAAAALLEARCLHQLKRLDEALERYEIAAASSQGDTRCEALIGLAGCAMEHGDLARSEQALDAVKPKDDDTARRVTDMRGRVEFDRLAGDEGNDHSAAIEAWRRWRQTYAGHALEGDALLAEAWAAHRAGQHEDSDALLSSLESKYPESAVTDSALLLTAESAYASEQYERALSGYAALQSAFPKSAQVDRCKWRRGMCLARLGRDVEAETELVPLFTSKDADAALRRSAAMLLGGRAMEREDYASGERWFALIADDASENGADALLRLGICMQRQGRHAEALKPLERAARDTEDAESALQARFECGQSRLELGELDRAKDDFEYVRTRDEQGRFKSYAMRHLATIASKQGRFDDASSLLQTLADSDPTGRAAFELGVQQMSGGRFAEAEKSFDSCIASTGNGYLKPKALVQLATALSRQGRHERALEALDRVGDSAEREPEMRAECHYARGVALAGLGRAADAASSLERAVTDPPCRMTPYALLELSRLAMAAKDYGSATAHAERSIAAAASSVPAADVALLEAARYALAASLARMNDHARAEAAAREFMEAHPRSALLPAVHVLRGEALFGLARASEAAEEFTIAHKSAPDDSITTTALLRAAECWAECQQWDRSASASDAFLKRYPQSDQWFRAMFALGWAHENAGRLQCAMEAYREVASRHEGPTAARAQFQIGECLFALKRHDDAVAEFVKVDVLHADPEWSAAALYEAGRCLMEQGREPEARAQFDDLQMRFPDTEWARLSREQSTRSADD